MVNESVDMSLSKCKVQELLAHEGKVDGSMVPLSIDVEGKHSVICIYMRNIIC
jgi:hypothetical protein